MPASSTLIVTADDFGLTSAVNRGIAASFSDGLVTHASLMVNMPATEEACDLARAARLGDRIGCHLNLAEGAPLTDAIRRSRTFCKDGCFNEPLSRSRFIPLGADDRRALAVETRAQIAAVRRAGFAGTYLDSHRYVHTMPNVASVVVGVAREMGVVRVRPYQNCGPTATGAAMIGKRLFNVWLGWRGVRGVDYFGGIDDLEWQARRGLRDVGSAEVMTHPVLDARSGIVVDGSAGPLRERLLALAPLVGRSLVASITPLRYDK